MNNITQLMINTANKKPTLDYSLEDANVSIRKAFAEALHIDAECKDKKTIRKALRRHKNELFDIIEDTVDHWLTTGWRENEFMQTFVETKNIARGDENLFYVPDRASILTVSEIADGTNSLIRQKLGAGKEYRVSTREFGIKVYDEFIRFQMGLVDWAALTQAMYTAIDRNTNDQIYESFMNLENDVPTGFKQTGSIDRAKAVNLAEAVSTANGGAEVVIAGTRSALSALHATTEAGWISDKMRDERNTTGKIGFFEGFTTMTIPNVFKLNTTIPAYPAKKLYFLPNVDVTPIKHVYEGDIVFEESTDPLARVDRTVEAQITYRAGFATIFGEYFGVYAFD